MKTRRRISQCLNCQNQLKIDDDFCSKCGQENHYHGNTIKEVWGDFLSSFLNFEGKVWVTFKNLMFRPGKVPKEYVQGKKKKYFPPFRVYLLSSFLFFLILNNSSELNDDLTLEDETEEIGVRDHNNFIISKTLHDSLIAIKSKEQQITYLLEKSDSTQNKTLIQKVNKYKNHITGTKLREQKVDDKTHYKFEILLPNEVDTIDVKFDNTTTKITFQEAQKIAKKEVDINEFLKERNPKLDLNWFEKKSFRFAVKTNISDNFLSSENKDFPTKLMEYASYSLIFMLPFTGFILYFLFYNKKKTYYQSFIFSIFAHSHLLLYMGIYTIFENVTYMLPQNVFLDTFTSLFFGASILFLLIFNVLSVKNFYQITWRRCIALSFVFYFIYAIISLIILGMIIFLIAFI